MFNLEAWRPSASLSGLRERARMISDIRAFFNGRDYLEVETPIMGQVGVTDLYLSNIQATFRGDVYWLQTSPEYHMKRLLAAGSGPIFQLARVFRDDELGRWHNPEFTLLEWYQLHCDHHDMLVEVGDLLQQLLNCPPILKTTYQQAFLDACHLDPLQTTIPQLKATVARFDLQGVLSKDEMDPDQYLFLLMSHVVEPHLATIEAPVAVIDFPASQASLAQIKQGVAERFEVYYGGVELANGFHELLDENAQRSRFENDLQLRQERGLPPMAVDHHLLAALRHGLPPCSGVALGVDRLLALALHQPSIAGVMAFDFTRA